MVLPLSRKDYCPDDLDKICRDFSNLHRNQYGYSMDTQSVQIVNLRLTAIGLLSKPVLKEEPRRQDATPQAAKYTRPVYMNGAKLEVPVYDRARLHWGNAISAPAIIEQADSTTVLFAGYRAAVDRFRNLIIEREA